MRTVLWNLRAGGKGGQELREEKEKKGKEYIEKLGDEVEEVIYEENRIVIKLKDE